MYCLRNRLLFFILIIKLLLSPCNVQAQRVDSLLIQLNQLTNKEEKILLLQKIGVQYQKQIAYKKALEYFKQAYVLEQELGDLENSFATLKGMAICYKYSKDYPKTIETYELLLKKSQNETQKLAILQELTLLYTQIEDFEKALTHTQQILEIHRIQANIIGISSTYNNLGYLYKKVGNKELSVKNYLNGLDILRLIGKHLSNKSKATMHLNIGVAYTSLRNYKMAQTHYYDALKMHEKSSNPVGRADAYNYIAANYYVSGKNIQALSAAQKAVELATLNRAENILLTSYKIIAKIYNKQDDLREYQKYNQLYENTQDKIEAKEKAEEQSILEKQIQIEKKENEITTLLADKERQISQLKASELEREKKEKELELLKRNQELQDVELRNQLLERERVEQLLAIAEQKTQIEKQRRIADMRKQEALKSKLLAEKREAEKEAAKQEREREKKAREAAENATKLKEQQLEKEQILRKYGVGVIALIGLILILVAIGFGVTYRSKRKIEGQHKQIQNQKVEIETQNEELVQNQEEIMTQRDNISKKNVDLQQRDRQITSSINAALTIQQAILPYDKKLEELLRDYFVIYRPKDVVSGDFYWLNEVNNQVVLVAVDCTGHGVPGAFMSLIGNTLLDKIVRVWKILDPAKALDRLHEDIRVMLRQEETKNNNGMDMVFITMEDIGNNQTKILFAGAKNSLYYIPAGENEIYLLKGDRKSIGGIQNEKLDFITQELILEKGSHIYLGSDGLEDQNNLNRKKFGSKKLKKTLLENVDLSMSAQKIGLEKELDEHMGGTQQRDDMLWIGIIV